jgi:hypothetical protein
MRRAHEIALAVMLIWSAGTLASSPAMVGPQWEAVQSIAKLSFLNGRWTGLSSTFDENAQPFLLEKVDRSVELQAAKSSLIISDELIAQLRPEVAAVIEGAGLSRKQRQSAFINYDVERSSLLLVVGGNVSSVAHTLGRTLLLPLSIRPGQVLQWSQDGGKIHHVLTVRGDEMIQITTQRSGSGRSYTSREIRLRRVAE